MGRRLEEMDKAELALPLYELNTELYPRTFQLFNMLAKAYFKLGKPDLARKACQRSLEIKPDNVEAVEMLQRIDQRSLSGI